MSVSHTKFQLNKADAKLSGVCAGLADYAGWDVTWVRVGAVAATVIGGFPWTLIAYGVTAWAARPNSATSRLPGHR
jgi:phage shock protein C